MNQSADSMNLFAFIDKVKHLNPSTDFSNVNRRMDLFREADVHPPIHVHHGAYFDMTNLVILRTMADMRSCPNWLRHSECQEFATRSLAGLFFHTDCGHAFDTFKSFADGKKRHFSMLFTPEDCRGETPFYTYLGALTLQNGITISVQPLRLFDGTETHLKVDDGGYNPPGIIDIDFILDYDKDHPHAYLVDVVFEDRIHPEIFPLQNGNWDKQEIAAWRANHGLVRPDDPSGHLFNSASVIYFMNATSFLAQIFEHWNIRVTSFYESNDADSSMGHETPLPYPLCDTEYIVSAKDCWARAAHYNHDENTHVVEDAWYRYNDYRFLGFIGEVGEGRWGGIGHDWEFRHFSDARLIFKKTDNPIDYENNQILREHESRIKARDAAYKEMHKLEKQIHQDSTAMIILRGCQSVWDNGFISAKCLSLAKNRSSKHLNGSTQMLLDKFVEIGERINRYRHDYFEAFNPNTLPNNFSASGRS